MNAVESAKVEIYIKEHEAWARMAEPADPGRFR